MGRLLLAEKLLSEAELASVLKVQVSEVIFDTFAWARASSPSATASARRATAVTLEMDLQNLLMEGVRRIDERARLAECLPRP